MLKNVWKHDFITNLDSEMRLKIYCEFQHILDHLAEVEINIYDEFQLLNHLSEVNTIVSNSNTENETTQTANIL